MMIIKYVGAGTTSNGDLQTEINHKQVGQLVSSNVPYHYVDEEYVRRQE